MFKPDNKSKIFIIVITTIGISLFHLTLPGSQMDTHMIHRELFFIPIILACFWFGLKTGLTTASIISLIYLSRVLAGTGPEMLLVPAVFQVFTFLLIALILGSLVNHNEKYHEENIRKQELAALGNAALNLGTEIRAVVKMIKQAMNETDSGRYSNDEIEEGFARLNSLTGLLISFISGNGGERINSDINLLVNEQMKKAKPLADEKGVTIEKQLDSHDCPTRVDHESVSKLIRDLLLNAIEASTRGSQVIIRTGHRPTYNILEVEDFGYGIEKEHLKKIFRPFFTTKKGSHGLSLASSYKFLQSCGGDAKVSSVPGKGTLFKVKIPIEEISRPVNTLNRVSDWIPKNGTEE